jgi:hypothetical protein
MPMTLEGCVVRIADVIAYIGRDVEDAITVGAIKRRDLSQHVVSVLGETNSQIINVLVMDLIEHSFGKGYLEFSEEVFLALKELLAFNYAHTYFILETPDQLAIMDTNALTLFTQYCRDLDSGGHDCDIAKYYLGRRSKEYTEETPRGRIAIDFISGMTDRFFEDQCRKHGLRLPSKYKYILEPIPEDTQAAGTYPYQLINFGLSAAVLVDISGAFGPILPRLLEGIMLARDYLLVCLRSAQGPPWKNKLANFIEQILPCNLLTLHNLPAGCSVKDVSDAESASFSTMPPLWGVEDAITPAMALAAWEKFCYLAVYSCWAWIGIIAIYKRESFLLLKKSRILLSCLEMKMYYRSFLGMKYNPTPGVVISRGNIEMI